MAKASRDYRPEPRQQVVLDCPVFEILYGGSKGCMKTELLIMMMMKYASIAHEYWKETGWRSKAQAVLFRGDFTRIADIENRCFVLFPQIDPGATYNSTKHVWRFSSGFRVTLISLEKPRAEEQMQGQEIVLLLGDQAEEVPEGQYLYLKMQVRTTDPAFIGREKIVLTANPIGQYVAWVKERFPVLEPNKIIEETYEFEDGDTRVLDRVFIPAKPKDNPHLSKSYWANLMSIKDPDERKAYLEGDWNVTLGTFFSGYFVERVHVQEVFLPKYGDWFMSGDWGSTSPACMHLHYKDGDNNIVTYDELYGPGITGGKWGVEVLAKIDQHGIDRGIQGYLDDSAWAKMGAEGLSPGEKMVEMGLNWFPARKPPGSRKPTLLEMRNRLATFGGVNGTRPAWIIHPRCVELIKCLKNVVKAEEDPDDIKNPNAQHALDSARYGITAYPLTEKQLVGKQSDHDNWLAQMREQDALSGLAGRSGSSGFLGYG